MFKHDSAYEKGSKKKPGSNVGPKLFTLGPDYFEGSDFPEPSEYEVYKTYLDKALSQKNVLNIAITGNYGIGKSRFLNWYAYKKRKKFLFVSLCDYTGASGEKSLSSLGCDVYRQLMIEGGMAKERIRKKKGCILFCITFLFTFIIFFYLLYFNVFGSLTRFAEIFDFYSTSRYDLFTFIVSARRIVDCISGCTVLVGIPLLAKWGFERVESAKLSVKAIEVEAEMQLKKKEEHHSFDLKKVDIVEELSKYSKEYDYTIIFEDFDRTNPDNSRALFTDLRELNRLINRSIHTEKNSVKFVYVLQDDLFRSNSNETSGETLSEDSITLKFFDLIIPFVPGIYGFAAAETIRTVLKEVGVNADCLNEFIDMVQNSLYDYRTIRNIANEFSIIKSVYYAGRETDELNDKHILALATYKTISPEEYACIRSKNSFPFDDVSIHKNKCIKALADGGWLGAHCLVYLGMNPTQIKSYILNIDPSKVGDTIRALIERQYPMMRAVMLFNQDDQKFLSLVLEHCAYTVLKLELSEYKTTELLEAMLELQNPNPEVKNEIRSSFEQHEVNLTLEKLSSNDKTEINALLSQLRNDHDDRFNFSVRYLLKVGCDDWSILTLDVDSFVSLTKTLITGEKKSLFNFAGELIQKFIIELAQIDHENFVKLINNLDDSTRELCCELNLKQSIKTAIRQTGTRNG